MKKYLKVIFICIIASVFIKPLYAFSNNTDSVLVEKKLLKKYTKISKTKKQKNGEYYYFVHNKKDNNVGLCDKEGRCIVKPKYYEVHVLNDAVILTSKEKEKKKEKYVVSVKDYNGNDVISPKEDYNYYRIYKNVVMMNKREKKYAPHIYYYYTLDFKKHVEGYEYPYERDFYDDFFVLDRHKLYDYNLKLLINGSRDDFKFTLSPITNTIWGASYNLDSYSHDYGVGIDGKQKYGKYSEYYNSNESAALYASKLKEKSIHADRIVGIYQDSTTLKLIDIVSGDSVLYRNVNDVYRSDSSKLYYGNFQFLDVKCDSGYYRYGTYRDSVLLKPIRWDNAEIVKGTNYTIAEKNGQKALYWNVNNEISFGKYDDIYHLDKKLFLIKKNNHVGLFDGSLKPSKMEIVKPMFDDISFYSTYVKVKTGTKYGAYTWDGIMIADTVYDDISYNTDLQCYKCTGKENLYVTFFKDTKYVATSYEALMSQISDRKAYDERQEELAREEAERKEELRRLEKQREEIEEAEERRQQEILREQRRIEKQEALQNLSTALGNLGQAIANANTAGKRSSTVSSGMNNSYTQGYSQSNNVGKQTIPAMKVTVVDKDVTGYSAETLEVDAKGEVWLGEKPLGKGSVNTGTSWGVSSTKFKYFSIQVANQRVQYIHFFNK